MAFKYKTINYQKNKNNFLYGYLIRKAREECEISILFLSQTSGISSSVLSRAEHGLTTLSELTKKLLKIFLKYKLFFLMK